MGVHNLWPLLEPVGRRVNIEAISNKKLAVDASIWLFQFMKAMRDEKGDMMRNAHLLGFFRRICRLLFHKVRPVFVFDGATPALKRSTNIERRRRREMQQVTLRKTAEKLLINQLKKQALEAARELRDQQGSEGDMQEGSTQEAVAGTSAKSQQPQRQKGVKRKRAAPASSSPQPGPGASPCRADVATLVPDAAQAGFSGVAAAAAAPNTAPDVIDVEDEAALSALKKGKAKMQPADGIAAGWLSTAAGKGKDALAQVELDEEVARQLDQQLNQPGPPSMSSAGAGASANAAAGAGAGAAAGAGAGAGAGVGPSSTHLMPAGIGAPAGPVTELSAADAAAIAAALQQDEEEGEVAHEADAFGEDELALMELRRQGGMEEELHALQEKQLGQSDAKQVPTPSLRRLVRGPLQGTAAISDRRTASASTAAQAAPDVANPLAAIQANRAKLLGTSGNGDGNDNEDEDEDDDGDGDLIVPTDINSLDPEVLSTLPPSVQLDILLKIRDAQTTANREKFQEAAASKPENFSSVQMQTYLKASAFRQQIESFKKNMGNIDAEGTQVQKVASDFGREFVFRKDAPKSPPSAGKLGGSSRGMGRRDSSRPHGVKSQLNAAALAAPPPQAMKMPLLSTKIALASFKGTYVEGDSPSKVGGRAAGRAVVKAEAVPVTVKEETQELTVDVSDLDTLAADEDLFGDPGGSNSAGLSWLQDTSTLSSVLQQQPELQQQDPAAASASASASASARNDADDVEWEDVGDEEPSAKGGPDGPGSSSAVAAQGQPVHWRQRMASRQRFWSTSHGFKLGRKLGEWGGAEPAATAAGGAGGASVDGGAGLEGEVEEAEMQEAIQLSLVDTGVAGNVHDDDDEEEAEGDDDVMWEDVEETPMHARGARDASHSQRAPSGSALPHQQQQPWMEPAGSNPPAAAAAAAAAKDLGSDARVVSSRPSRAAAIISTINRTSQRILDEGDALNVQHTVSVPAAPAAPAAATAATTSEPAADNAGDVTIDIDAFSFDFFDDSLLQRTGQASTGTTAVAAAHAASAATAIATTTTTTIVAAAATLKVSHRKVNPAKLTVPAAGPMEVATGSHAIASFQGADGVTPNTLSYPDPAKQQLTSVWRQHSADITGHLDVASAKLTKSYLENDDMEVDLTKPTVGALSDVRELQRAQQPALGEVGMPIISSQLPVHKHTRNIFIDECSSSAYTAATASILTMPGVAVLPKSTTQAKAASQPAALTAIPAVPAAPGAPTAAHAAPAVPAEPGESLPGFERHFPRAWQADHGPAAQVGAAEQAPPQGPAAQDDAAQTHQQVLPVPEPARPLQPPPSLPHSCPASIPSQQPAAQQQQQDEQQQQLPAAPQLSSAQDPTKLTAATSAVPPPSDLPASDINAELAAIEEEQQQQKQNEHQLQAQQQAPYGAAAAAPTPPPSEPSRPQTIVLPSRLMPPPPLDAPPLDIDAEIEAMEAESMAEASWGALEAWTMEEPPFPQSPEEPTTAGAAPHIDIDAELVALEQEDSRLRKEQARASKLAEAPTTEMYQECQELLQMFGLPFIVAPVEAEAQCAWLDSEGMVDGVVTDDNDVFLFGGTHVYRNIFDNKRYVEEYRIKDVESELGLNRERLTELALLLGSDYTEGVAGIGIVNAIEVVQAFPGEAGLKKFRQWVEAPDSSLLSAAKRMAGKEAAAADGDAAAEDDDSDAMVEFKRHHRGVRKSWQLPSSFPSSVVLSAYRQPHVDRNKTKFAWGRPDLQLLRIFCMDKFGWAQDKTDELLVPVLKAYDARQTQLTMDQFLSFSQRFAKIRSKRLQQAVAKITGTNNPDINLADVSDLPSIDEADENEQSTSQPAKQPSKQQNKQASKQPRRKAANQKQQPAGTASGANATAGSSDTMATTAGGRDEGASVEAEEQQEQHEAAPANGTHIAKNRATASGRGQTKSTSKGATAAKTRKRVRS